MIPLVITVALLIAMAGALVFGFYLVDENSHFTKGDEQRVNILPVWIAALVLAVLVILSLGIHEVDAGFVGVVTNFGRVEDRTLTAGLQYVMPLAEDVVDIDTRVQPHDFQNIDAASKEYQSVKASGKLNYHIDPAYAYIVYRQVGLDFASKVIDPALNDFIKEEMPKFAITDILPQRDQIRADTIKAMNANLARYHIVVDDIYLANISFSDAYEKAIEDKQVAQQGVQTQQQLLDQAKIKAQQVVVTAQGQADANKVLTASLTPELIQWTAINKLNDNISVLMLPTGSNFLLDTRSLVPAQAVSPTKP